MELLQTGTDVLVARRTAGLTQAQLAKLAGMHRATLSRVEWSRKRLTAEQAQRIQRALELDGGPADPGPKAA